MSARGDGPREVRALRGRVVRSPYARGSKSEREALWLETPEGTLLVRFRQGPSFPPYGLEHLVGSQVECDGTILPRQASPGLPGAARDTGHDLLLLDRVDKIPAKKAL
jgi:hypothetical protein